MSSGPPAVPRRAPVIGLRQGYGQTSPKLQQRRALPSAPFKRLAQLAWHS